MNAEHWLPIPVDGYRDHYEISDLGRVRRSAPGNATQVGKVRALALTPAGHPIVRLSARGITRCFAVASLVASAFLPPKPFPKAVLKHRDSDRANCAVANLEWAQTGDPEFRPSRRKLSAAEIEEVLSLRGVLPPGVVARRYGVSATNIRSTWKNGK